MKPARNLPKAASLIVLSFFFISHSVQCAPLGQQADATPPGLSEELAAAIDGELGSSLVESRQMQHLRMGREDPLALLIEAQARWEAVPGYRLTLHSRERMGKVIGGTSVIEATVMRRPCAVAFRWRSNAGQIDRLIWMPSRFDGQLLVRPTGILGSLVKVVRLDPHSDRVRKTSRRSVTQFGLANTLRRLVEDYRDNLQAGTLTSECVGLLTWGPHNTPAMLLKRTTTGRDNESRTVLLWLGAEDLRPLQIKQFGWSDELLASYTFDNYRPMELSGKEFTLAAMGMD